MIAVPRALAAALLVCGCLMVCAPAGAAPTTIKKQGSTTTTTTTASADASRFYITGGGYGHGVGMSQYGAAGFALHGYDYERILAHYYSGTTLARLPSNRTVTVLLHQGAAIFSGASAAVGSFKKLNPALNYGVYVDGSKLRVMAGKHLFGIFPSPLIVHNKGGLHGTGAPLTFDESRAYDGVFIFRPDGAHGVMTVNSVGLDDYVRGVVTAEMPSRWPSQALEAQAIAARTYAVAAPPVNADFDVYDDTRSQMYVGVDAESPAGDAAVSATAGKVVEYAGRPAVTYFFASSGGHTESVQNVWYNLAPLPWLRGVTDPYDDSYGNPYYRWTRSYTLAAAEQKLGRLYGGTFTGVKITRTGVSPRIVNAQVVGSGGADTVTGVQLQRLFGTMSTQMSFTTLGEQGERTKTVVKPPASQFKAASASGKRVTVQLSLQGTVFPATRGQTVIAQRWEGASWHSVARARLAAKGTYVIDVKAPGTYRTVYQGLDGPNVRVP
jgi:stage II sporulation protein D